MKPIFVAISALLLIAVAAEECFNECSRSFCKYGPILNSYGCPLQGCPCKDRPSPPRCGPVCAIFCKYGNVPDKRGCPTCDCKPAPVHQGICPPLRTATQNSNCEDDGDCKSDRKCCAVGAHFLCIEPDPCPVHDCPQDAPACTKYRKDENGCETCDCEIPVLPQEKPGVCPRTAYGFFTRGNRQTCNYDSDCSGNKKCCEMSRFWRRKVCMDPLGKCPSRLGDVVIGPYCPRDQCTNDDDCHGNMLCCGGCPRRCVQAE